MAQQQQQRPGQPPNPLDQLQGMLNLVLMQVGDMLSSPAKRKDPAKRLQLQHMIPGANGRFQETLDKFEDEISRAKAVMRRDLALHLAAREQREKAAQAEKEKPAPVEQKDETVMREEDKKVAEIVSADESAQTQPPATSSAPDAKPAVTTSSEDWALPLSSTAPATLPTDPFATTSPTTTEIKDLDFDSMFENFTNTSPQELGTANAFDASADQQTSAVFDATGSFESGHADAAGGDGAAGGDLADVTDVSSLLRGIEGYANIDNTGTTGNTEGQQIPTTQAQDAENADDFDFSMLDLPADGEQRQDGELGESTFDELFDIGDFELGDATADGGGGGLSDDFWKELE